MIARKLLDEGAIVRAYDPAAGEAAATLMPGLDVRARPVRSVDRRRRGRAAHGVGRVPLARLRARARRDARRGRSSTPATCSTRPRCAAAGFAVQRRSAADDGRIVVTGGAGFVGSHLCEALLERGDEVVAVDNLSTGRRENVEHLADHPGFELVVADVVRRDPGRRATSTACCTSRARRARPSTSRCRSRRST